MREIIIWKYFLEKNALTVFVLSGIRSVLKNRTAVKSRDFNELKSNITEDTASKQTEGNQENKPSVTEQEVGQLRYLCMSVCT